jgi:hypothetical protein
LGTTLNKIREEIQTEFGGGPDGFVNVELSEEAYKNIIRVAKRWFVAKKGFLVYRPVLITDGVLEYKMKDDVAQVVDVIFQVPSDVAAFFTLGFFDIIPYGPNTLLSVGSGMSNYSGFAQLLDYTQKRKRVFSVEPEWYYEQQTRILHITARGGTPNGAMLIYCKLTDFDPSTLSDKDDYMFVRYCKAVAKKVIGRIRSKYDNLPAASGPVGLDGKTLLEEAKDEMEKLDIEIYASQGPDGGLLA